MTDRLRRERELPAGYQFGDVRTLGIDWAGGPDRSVILDRRWITKSESDAHPHWNVIEGDPHDDVFTIPSSHVFKLPRK